MVKLIFGRPPKPFSRRFLTNGRDGRVPGQDFVDQLPGLVQKTAAMIFLKLTMVFSWFSHGFLLKTPWFSHGKTKSDSQVLKVFDLSDSNEFEFDAETFSKISLQCGNERVRLRGQPEQMRRWCLGQNKEPVQKWLDSWVGCRGQFNTSYI